MWRSSIFSLALFVIWGAYAREPKWQANRCFIWHECDRVSVGKIVLYCKFWLLWFALAKWAMYAITVHAYAHTHSNGTIEQWLKFEAQPLLWFYSPDKFKKDRRKCHLYDMLLIHKYERGVKMASLHFAVKITPRYKCCNGILFFGEHTAPALEIDSFAKCTVAYI